MNRWSIKTLQGVVEMGNFKAVLLKLNFIHFYITLYHLYIESGPLHI